MSSEAITQNDLREILSRTVGSIPSEYKKLLWTNPSPTSAMSGGTTIVASGADEYDAIEVEYKTAHIYDGYETASAPFVVGAHITLFAPAGTGGEFSGANYNAVRTISMGAGGVLMVDGAIGMTSSGTTGNNNMCIPYKVYGIKYERVAPPQVNTSDYVVEQGAGYRKWDSGVMEQWGAEASASSANHQVTLPVPFVSNNYIVLGTNTSGTQSNFMTSNTSASYFYVYPVSSTRLFWIAIGRWK